MLRQHRAVTLMMAVYGIRRIDGARVAGKFLEFTPERDMVLYLQEGLNQKAHNAAKPEVAHDVVASIGR